MPIPGFRAEIVDPDTGIECRPRPFDEHGRLLNAEEAIGEIVNPDGAGSFEGYYNNPEANAERIATASTGPATSATATTTASSTLPAATPIGYASTARTSRRHPSSRSLPAIPTSCWPRSTRCRHPTSATR